jgi:adenylyltransferase/sulfurtransferase
MTEPGQLSVLLVGVGGLECFAALELVAAGVGRLGLLDPDAVALDNLHRQVLYTTADVGRPKVEAAADRLRALRPGLVVESWRERFTPARLEGWDLVLEGTDDLDCKFAVNDACVAADVPCVIGGVVGWRGVVVRVDPGGPCYRCVFEAPPPEAPPTCAQAGVFGPVAGAVGARQAQVALARSVDPVWVYDAAEGVARSFPVDADPACGAHHPHRLDVTGEICPMTYVRTRLALEDMLPGERLALVLRRGEPELDVSANLREEGHRVLSTRLVDVARVSVLVQKA